MGLTCTKCSRMFPAFEYVTICHACKSQTHHGHICTSCHDLINANTMVTCECHGKRVFYCSEKCSKKHS